MPVVKITEQKPEIGRSVIAKLLLGNTVKYSVGVRESEIGYKCNFTGFHPVCPILEWAYISDIHGNIDYHRVNLSDPMAVHYAFMHEKNNAWGHGTKSKTPMQEFTSIKNELPNEDSACMVKPFFGGELLSIYRGGKFHGCAYDFVIDKSAIESWAYFNSKAPQEDLNPGEGDLVPSHCGPNIFLYWNGPSDEKIMHGERLEYLGWHKDGEKIGVKSCGGGVHFVARDHISAEPPAKENTFLSKAFAECDKSIKKIIEDRLKAAGKPVRHFAPISPGDELRDLTDSILKRQMEDMERALYQVEYPVLEHPFGKSDEPECQNPTALMLRQIADQIESGDKTLTSMEIKNETREGMPTDDGWRTLSATGRTIITFEIVEDLA